MLPRIRGDPVSERLRGTMKLTDTNIKRIGLNGKADHIEFDDDLVGFGLRLRAGGSRKFVVHYRQGGIQRRHTIGSAASMSVDEARKRARKVLVQVDDGKDPAAEKAAKRVSSALLLSAVIDDYLAVQQRTMK